MKNKKIGLIIIMTIIVLSSLSSNVISSTTIGNSTVSVEEGEVYSWQWDYIDFWLQPFTSLRQGDTVKFTIEKIYRGAHQSINHTLLLNITIEENMSGETTISNRPAYVAYNNSLDYINLQSHDPIRPHPMIIPIPLNLTLIAGFYESIGETCTIEGNTLIFVRTNMTDEYTFNSDGILTKYEYINNDKMVMRMVLMGPFPLIIIVASIAGGIGVAVISIYLLRKRKRARELD
ncbi:MAG: hypothetical protein ACTSP9_08285 [Promethearchaeota archaeon]